MTSPPYFGLRSYAGAQVVRWPGGVYAPCTGAPVCVEVPEMECAFGSEKTVESYIWHTLLVLRECWRVLRDDGVMWWDIGDSYAGSWGNYSGDNRSERSLPIKGWIGREKERPAGSLIDISAGNLIGIPQRIFLAAQADGWVMRNEAVWHKLAPMPESVNGWRWVRHRVKVKKQATRTDRTKKGQLCDRQGTFKERYESGDGCAVFVDCPGCPKCREHGGYILKQGSWRHTRSHESIFMMTKGMGYWADGEVVKEAQTMTSKERRKYGHGPFTNDNSNGARTGSSFLDHENSMLKLMPADGLKNPRSVITPKPSGYSGAHFATFPPDLVRRLIKGTVPRRCCPECGTGWAAVVEVPESRPVGSYHDHSLSAVEYGKNQNGIFPSHLTPDQQTRVIGYRPSCRCGHKHHIPGLVFDPFLGSGTVGKVARELGVNFVGSDISFEYLHAQAMERATGQATESLRREREENVAELPLFQGVL